MIAEGALGRSAGWVSVGPDERDPQRFWLSVFDALRDTEAGSALVRQLTAAPDLDPWAMVEWLLEDLSLDTGRSWFRYHQLFADLLQMELRRTEPDEIRALHSAAAEWFASHGYPVEAVRHAQMAQDWSWAARLLSDRWLGLVLDGQATAARDLLAAFPSPPVTGDAELAAAAAGIELARGSLEVAGRHLAVAEQELPSVPPDRRTRFEATLAVLRLQLARQRGDVPTLAEGAIRLLATADAPQIMRLELGEDLRAVALISLGTAESWTGRFTDAERHLDQGMALARRIRRPNLELTGLIAYGTALTIYRSYALGEQRCMQAVELAERHGWPEEPSAGGAYALLGATMVDQARLEEAERWLGRAERTLRAEAEPRTMIPLYSARGLLELVSGRLHDARVASGTAEQFAGRLITQGGDFRGLV